MNIQTPVSAMPDFAAIKSRQQMAWASGDYAVVGTTLQIVGEMLCEAVDLRAGWEVLDVATGSGNTALAAARREQRVLRRVAVGEPPAARIADEHLDGAGSHGVGVGQPALGEAALDLDVRPDRGRGTSELHR